MSERLRNYFRSCPLTTPGELADGLGVSRSTVLRQIKSLIEQGDVARIGQGKNTQYLYVKPVADITQPIVLQQINENAQVEVLGKLWITYSGSLLALSDGSVVEYDDLPWYIFDLKPQGFIGRRIAKRVCKNIKAPAQLDLWTSHDVLRFLVRFQTDLPGNLQLCLADYLPKTRGTHNTSLQKILDAYDDQATKNSVSVHGQSTAGGEQAKFTSTRRDNDIYKTSLVKYSPNLTVDNPVAVRIRDLLICEHLALEVLREYNGRASETKLLFSDTRVYLEVSRFDRVVNNNLQGRIGMVSLASVIAEYCGYAGDWVEASIDLQKEGLISDDDYRLMHTWLAYSRYIGNSDTHNGNISLYFNDLKIGGLTPAYDMLPMRYMPVAGDVYLPKIVINKPKYIEADSWSQGRELGILFWKRVAADSRTSDEFTELAGQWLAYIAEHEAE
ncbi:MAG: biotin operon repressor [Oleiphilaceae bacterium]|jgi:biotin operon repressor